MRQHKLVSANVLIKPLLWEIAEYEILIKRLSKHFIANAMPRGPCM